MSLETAVYVKDLIATNPAFDDPKAQGDDHLRLIKSTLTVCFANVGGEMKVVVTPAALHTWTGTHNFDGSILTALTQATTANNTLVATTAFVQSLFTATPASLAWRSRMMFWGGNR